MAPPAEVRCLARAAAPGRVLTVVLATGLPPTEPGTQAPQLVLWG